MARGNGRALSRGLLTHLLFWFFCGLLAVVHADAARPVGVTVVHRHGARTPIVSVNQSGVCRAFTDGAASACGQLSKDGKEMIHQLGRHLRTEYNDTILPFAAYDPGAVVSRSTDVARTLQSAAELVRGLYAHLADVDPVVHTVPLVQDDLLLVWDGMPALVLLQAAWDTDFMRVMRNVTLERLAPSELEAMGAEVGLLEECATSAPQYDPFSCALDLQDVWFCSVAAGIEARFPLLASHSVELTEVLIEYNAWAEFKFDETYYNGSFIRNAGTLGFELASQVLRDARRAALSSSHTETSPVTLTHYSGHDTTLLPLLQTLGNTTFLNPVFGAAVVFETYAENEAAGVGPSVRVRLGAPDQAPASGFPFEFSDLILTCTNTTTNEEYTSTRCPLDDLAAYVTTRGPASPLGTCYASNAMLHATNCTPGASTGDPSPACLAFRRACSLVACGPSFFMTPNLTCAPITPPPSPAAPPTGQQISIAFAVVIAVLCVVVGALLWARHRAAHISDDASSAYGAIADDA